MKTFETISRAGLTLMLVLGVFLSGGRHAPAVAADASDFYKGKTVRIIVGYSPGGGYDTYARMLAPHLEKQLGATVIVENRTGGAGLSALNSLVRDKADGLRMMLVNGEGAVLAQLIDRPGTRFDVAKLEFLGRVSYENRILLAAANSPFKKIDAFLSAKTPVKFGSSGRIDGMGDMASIFCRALKIPCKLITGYKGASETALALLRDEVNAQVTSESQSAKLSRGGKLVPVAVLARNKAPLLPGTPTIFELVKMSPAQAKWIDFRAGISDIGRTFVVRDGVPKNRGMFLQNALRSVLTDKGVVAAAKKIRRPISYAPPSDTRKVIKRIFGDLDANERKEIKDLILNGY